MKKEITKIVLVMLLIFLPAELISQGNGNITNQFEEARKLAYNDQRNEAILLCKKILKFSPESEDVRIFLARVLGWQKRFDEARSELNNLKRKNVESVIALKLDIEYWSKNHEQLLKISDQGLESYPNNEEFLYKKAFAQEKLNDFEGSGELINRLLDLNPSNEKAILMRDLIKLAGMINSAAVNYNINLFDRNFDPWHNVSLDLSRKFNFGSLIFRLNYASRFDKTGYQFESDGYIRVVEGMYSYLNLGYSPTNLFPEFRAGVEPYFKLPLAMEISIGYRYLLFSGKGVDIFTGHLGKYLGNYWMSLRPFITPKKDRTDFSGIFIIRRYFSNADNYLSLQAGLGFIPSDEISDSQLLQIDSKKIGIDFQTSLSKFLIIKTSLEYAYEEYYPNRWRNNYDLKLGIKRRF